MEVGGTELAIYVVQAALIVSDALAWQLETLPEYLAVPSLILLGALLFLTIYSNNQNEKKVKDLKDELGKIGKQVAFLMKPHKQRRRPPV